MQMRGLVLFSMIVLMTSCLKKEEPMTLPPHGDAIFQTLNMGSDYSNQFYYDLTNSKVVHSSKVDSWHLSFESAANSETVFLNGGIGMGLVKTERTDFDNVGWHDCEGETWWQDNPNGKREEAAFGNWNENESARNTIYILRLDATNKNVVTIKLKSVDEYQYQIEVGDIDNGKIGSYTIKKDPTRVYTYFNLEDLEVRADVEPIKESWDLLFTRYGFTFYDQSPPLPYIVTGVLTNPLVKTHKDSLHSFYDIEEDILTNCELKPYRDVIGFDWKYYDFDMGLYHIRKEYNYIIKTQNENYFKMRFSDFYDNNGLKGSPTFEFRQIK
jgi:hypothetical protein